MIIMGLDMATKFGWAVYDTARPMSAIESGSIQTEGTIVGKMWMIRNALAPLILKYSPQFVAIEAPLRFAPQYGKKGKADLLGEGDEGGGTINPSTLSELGEIAGCACGVVMSFNIHCCQVEPVSWQTIISKDIRDAHPSKVGGKKVKGASKARVKDMCDRLKVVSPNQDSRDAVLIAVWASTQQQVKILQG